jgi:hypothetical protein
MNKPNWQEDTRKILVLLGQGVVLADKVIDLIGKIPHTFR